MTVAQFTFSDQLIVTLLFNAMPVAPLVGIVELTVGAVVSTTTVLGVANTADTLPAASFAQGYNVYVPSDATVYVAGAVPVQPAAPAEGGVADVVMMYPVTAVLSVAVNDVTGIFKLVEGVVAVKAVTVGAVVSIVVYEKEEFAAIVLLFASLTPVVTVTEYNVDPACPLVVKIA